MPSRQYLREQFEKLETEAERACFGLKVIYQSVWARNEGQKDMLPEGFTGNVMDHLRGALTDAGRPDLYKTLDRAIVNRELNKKRGLSEADSLKRFLQEVLGEHYVEPTDKKA